MHFNTMKIYFGRINNTETHFQKSSSRLEKKLGEYTFRRINGAILTVIGKRFHRIETLLSPASQPLPPKNVLLICSLFSRYVQSKGPRQGSSNPSSRPDFSLNPVVPIVIFGIPQYRTHFQSRISLPFCYQSRIPTRPSRKADPRSRKTHQGHSIYGSSLFMLCRCCLVPRLHFSSRPKRFGSRGPCENVRRFPPVRLGYVTETN